MKQFIRLCIFCIALLGAIGSAFAQSALPPLIMKSPVATATHAKNAKLMLYVQALPRDEGTLSYQWYYSSSPTSTPATATEIPAPNGTSFTLDSITPDITNPDITSVTYYYYCVVTNRNGTATSSVTSATSVVKVVNRDLEPQLMNGDFQTFRGTYPLKSNANTNNNYDTAPIALIVDGNSKSGGEFIPYWNTTHDGKRNADDTGAGTGNAAELNATNGKVIELQEPGSTYGTSGAGQNLVTTGHAGAGQLTDGGSVLTNVTNVPLIAELSAAQSSSLYQDIATKSGKIYEWSLDHASSPGKTTTSVMAVVIGPAINASTDYVSVQNRYKIPADYQITRTNPAGNTYAGTYSHTYPYGKNNGTYFNDIVSTITTVDGVAMSNVKGTTANATTEGARRDLNNKSDAIRTQVVNYNGNNKYYVYLSSEYGKATGQAVAGNNDTQWTKRQGVYSVPEGSGTTTFAFVWLASEGATGGNFLDNIVFKSGSSPVAASAMFYNGKVSLSAQNTKVGYVYGIAEVHGSTVSDINVTATFPGKTAEQLNYTPNGSDGISHWYYPNAEGTITFEDLTPGKTYRIIGIPAGAVSGNANNQLNTNKSPAEVLDDGYYAEKTIPAAWEGNEEQMATATASAVSADKAEIYVTNTNQSVEYALVDYELPPEDPNYVVFPWTPGKGVASEDGQNGIPIVFDGLQADHCYVVAARPGEYIEVTYKEAAELAPKGSGLLVRTPVGVTGANTLQDIQLSQIERLNVSPTEDKITLKDTDSDGEYGLYNPKTGYFLATDGTTSSEPKLQPGGGTIVFTGLETNAIYHLTVKEKTTTTSTDPCEQAKAFMVGVRVYPFPATLQIDYVNERIFDDTNLPDKYISKEVEYRMQANATLPVVGKDYWLAGKGDDSEHPTGIWQDAKGTNFLKLGETQNGNASLLDSIKILNAPEATFYYRLHPVDVDGWIGPSYAPENESLTIPCRPNKPVINECDVSPAPDKTYTLDYRILPEKIIVNADSLAYSVNNGVKFTTIPNSNSDPVPDTPNEILLTALGWSVSPMTVPLRFPAVPDELGNTPAFASDTTVQQLLGRGPAPTTPYAEIIGTEGSYQINILGLDDTVDYQYKLKIEDDTHWTDIIATEDVTQKGPLPMTSDYEIRFAPTCEKPASISQVLSVPLSIRTVNFGTLQYGYDATNIVDTIVIRNVATDLDMPFDPDNLELITDDNTSFSIIPRTDITLTNEVERLDFNKEYLIVLNSQLPAGNYHTTIQLKYNGDVSIATADVYLTVEKIQWPNDLEATSHIDPDEPTQFCLDITPDPEKGYPTDEITDANAIIEYSINDVYDKTSNGTVTNSCFTGLTPATAYDVYYRVQADPNHYESTSKILPVKTPYALDCTEKVTYIDYKEEMLYFTNGSYRSDSYTVSISLTETGPETEVSVPYQVSAEAETGFWVHVRHTGPEDFPESKSCSYSVAARDAAPAMDKITINGTNKTIALDETPGEDEEFQYRVAGNANIMANWQSAFNITGTLNYGGYEIRRPPVLTVGDTEGKFASKFTTATLLAPLDPTSLKNLYVDIRRKDQIGEMDGSTWKDATPSLAHALDHASAHAGQVERIFVAVGTYKPDENNIDRTKSFKLPSNVIITGGYETSADGNAVPDSIHKSNTATILSGDLGIEGDASDNSYHVVDASGATNVTMKGFVITGGNADTGNGGGVYVVNSSNANTLKLINVDIHSNSAANGGGIYLDYGTATLTNVTISANEATTNGGGIYRNNGTVTLNNTIVYGNTVLASANVATSEIYPNPTTGITYNYSLVKNMALTGTNFPGTTDPLFVDALGKDFRLSSESTVRNVGNDGLYKTARNNNESGYNWDNEADAAGKRRFRGIIDLGAYEALSLDASPTTICSGETSTLSIDPTGIQGIYSTSKADSIIAIVGDGNILHSDVYVSSNGELLDRPNHDVNEGAGGLITVIFTANDDGNSATKKILVKPRTKTPTLRWVYDGICTFDQSGKDSPDDEDYDVINHWINGLGGNYSGDTPPVGYYPDSTDHVNNYFANYVRWDYIVNNGVSDTDPDFYNPTANLFQNIIWHDASVGGSNVTTALRDSAFWQNEVRPENTYWASVINGDSCESRRIPVTVRIDETPEELTIPSLVGYVQPINTPNLSLSNFLKANDILVDETMRFEWYATLEAAQIVSNGKPNGEGEFTWEEADAQYTIPAPTLDLTQVTDITYYIIRADATGCRSLPTPLHIQLFPMPAIEITADKSLICPGTEVTTTVTIDGGTAPYNFTLESGYTSPVYVTGSSETTHTFTWSPFNIATFTISAFSDAIPTASITAPYWDADLEKVIDLGVVKPHPNYFAKTTVNMIVSAITSISPNFGPLEGGTYTENALDPIDKNGTITIHGYGFAPLGTSLITKVLFGGDEYAADIKSVTDNTITCVPPSHAKGVVTVSVFACVTIQLTDAYHYEPVHIIDVSPAYGPVTGGTEVTIKGIGLWDSTKSPAGVRVWLDDKEVIFDRENPDNIKINELHFTSAPSDKALLDRIVVLNGTGGDQREFPDRWTYYPVVFIKDGVWSEPYNWEAQTDDRILPYPGADIQIKANILQDIDLTSENIVDDYPKFKMGSITVDPKKAYTVALGKTLNANVFTLKDDASFLNFGNMLATQQNVEHLLTKGRNWYISSPVQGGTAPTIEDALGTGALGGNLTTDGNVVFTPPGVDNTDWRVEWYQESTHNWQRLTLGSPFETGLGYTAYSANEDIAAKFSGIYADGDNNSIPIIYTSPLLTRTGTDEKRGYNLVGNPFPSYWHWTEDAAQKANLYSTIWYRTNRTTKKDSGETGIYEFWSYNASGAVSVAPGWDDDTPSGSYSLAYVPPMQAFWVRVKDGQTGTLTFANSQRAHADHLSNVLRAGGRDIARNVPTEETRPMLRLRVGRDGACPVCTEDEVLIYADEAAFNRFDDYDSDKWFNNQGVEIFTFPVSENRALAINGLSSITDGLEIPLGFQADEGGAFSFRAKEILNLDTHNVFLRDKWLNEDFNLRSNNKYSFTSGSTQNTERFSIVFRSTGTDLRPVTDDRILVYADKSGHIIVALYDKNWKGSEAHVSVFDIAGRKLTEQAITIGEHTTLDGAFTEGVYLLRAGKWSTKVIVNF